MRIEKFRRQGDDTHRCVRFRERDEVQGWEVLTGMNHNYLIVEDIEGEVLSLLIQFCPFCGARLKHNLEPLPPK